MFANYIIRCDVELLLRHCIAAFIDIVLHAADSPIEFGTRGDEAVGICDCVVQAFLGYSRLSCFSDVLASAALQMEGRNFSHGMCGRSISEMHLC